MKVSGNTRSLISSSAACSMSCTVFLMVAALFMKTGAAWAAATLNLVSFGGAMLFRLDLKCAWRDTSESRLYRSAGRGIVLRNVDYEGRFALTIDVV
jgi:hypothetical protein